MYIEIKDFTLKLNYQEACDIYSSITVALKHTIVTHWRNHKDCWPKDEDVRLAMLKELSRVTGHNYKWEVDQLTALLNSNEPLA